MASSASTTCSDHDADCEIRTGAAVLVAPLDVIGADDAVLNRAGDQRRLGGCAPPGSGILGADTFKMGPDSCGGDRQPAGDLVFAVGLEPREQYLRLPRR